MDKSKCKECADEGVSTVAMARDLCKAHYWRARRAGRLSKVYEKRGESCEVDDCSRPVKAKGLCNPHYARAHRGGAVDAKIRGAQAPVCTFEGCANRSHSGGMCSGHYRQRRAGEVLRPLKKYKKGGGACEVDDCTRLAAHDGLCATHYTRKREGRQDWAKPIKKKAKDGSGHVDKDGYRVIQVNGRKVGEHRHFAEQVMGRPLLPTENVHHVNGDRADNRTDGPFAMDERGRLRSGNLEVWSSAQPAGQEIGPKVAWARSLLAVYGTAAECERYADHFPGSEE